MKAGSWRWLWGTHWRRVSTLGLFLGAIALIALSCTDASTGSMRVSQQESASLENPVAVDGNPDCSDLFPGTFEYKVEFDEKGDFSTSGLNWADISINVRKKGTEFYWWSSLGVDAVIVKGGSSANVWSYAEAIEGGWLSAPLNSGGNIPALSHISFCYDFEVQVTKTVAASFTRAYDWDIVKTATPSELDLQAGEVGTVAYDISPSVSAPIDSDWHLSGVVTIANPSPFDVEIYALNDSVAHAEIVCDPGLPVVLSGLEYVGDDPDTVTCDYNADMPNGDSGTNTVRVMTDNAPVLGMHASAEWDFVTPTELIDECATIVDEMLDLNEQVCVDPAENLIPHHVDYNFGSFPCGATPEPVENTATITEVDSGRHVADSAVVNISVASCEVDTDTDTDSDSDIDTESVIDTNDCTLTQGYWKTHSSEGPAPYDETWDGLESAVFYQSGMTYLQVLWTPPKGDAFYILPHQYIAAVLNGLRGASVPEDAADALSHSEDLFSGTVQDARRDVYIELAETLADFNEGGIGPGHCDAFEHDAE